MTVDPRTADWLLCPAHTASRHIFIHEASHAVAGLDHDIAFPSITIEGIDALLTAAPGELVAVGGIDMPDPDASTWVPANKVGSFKFLSAGVTGENVLLGHQVDTVSTRGDMKIWQEGMGQIEGIPVHRLPRLLERPTQEVFEELRNWILLQRPRIEAVADQLAAIPERPRVMTHAEVVAIAGSRQSS